MASVNINVRVDEDVKREAEFLFDDLGLNMTTAMNMFLKACLRNNGIPFDLYRKPNAETLEAMKEVEYMEKNPDLCKGYTDVDEMMRELLS